MTPIPRSAQPTGQTNCTLGLTLCSHDLQFPACLIPTVAQKEDDACRRSKEVLQLSLLLCGRPYTGLLSITLFT